MKLTQQPPTVLHIRLVLNKPSRVHSPVNSKACAVRSRKKESGSSDRFTEKPEQALFTLSPLEWPETQLSAWRSRNAAHLPLSFTNAKLSKESCWKDGLSELVKHHLQCSTFLSHHRNLSFMCQSGQLWYFSQRALHRAHHLNPENCKKLSLSSSLNSP